MRWSWPRASGASFGGLAWRTGGQHRGGKGRPADRDKPRRREHEIVKAQARRLLRLHVLRAADAMRTRGGPRMVGGSNRSLLDSSDCHPPSPKAKCHSRLVSAAGLTYTHRGEHKRQAKAESLLSRRDAEGDRGRGDSPGSVPVMDRPEGLEGRPQGPDDHSVGRRPFRRTRKGRIVELTTGRGRRFRIGCPSS